MPHVSTGTVRTATAPWPAAILPFRLGRFLSFGRDAAGVLRVERAGSPPGRAAAPFGIPLVGAREPAGREADAGPDGVPAGESRPVPADDPLGALVRAALDEYPHATTAFGELVRRTWNPVYQVCQAVLLNAHDAEEATQETFLRAHRHLTGFRGDSRVLGWLRTIARNAALSRLDSRRREREVRDRVAGDPVLSGLWRPGLRRSGNLSTDVRRALEALGPDDRMVVVLHDLAGVPHSEIAEEMGVSPGAVRMRLLRARKRLRSRLGLADGGASR